jgi:hypothetical protein
MEKRFSFGVVRSKQTRLRGFGGTAGAVGFGSFAGDSVPVQRRLGEEIKRLWREQKLMLRDWQAASVSFHGGWPFKRLSSCREVGLIFVAGVAAAAGAKLAARVLPSLAFPVPMETKLRQGGGNLGGWRSSN